MCEEVPGGRGGGSGPDWGQAPRCPPTPRELCGRENGSLEEGPALGSSRRASVTASQASSSNSRSSEVIPVLSGHQLLLQHWDSHFTEHGPQSRVPCWFRVQNVGQTVFASSGKPHCEYSYRREVFAREGKQGETRANTRPGLRGIWVTASAISGKRPSRVGPQVLFFSFSY